MGSLPDIPLPQLPALEPITTASAASADHSRFVQRIRRRYALELPLLAPGLPRRDGITALIETLLAGGRPLGAALRVARQLVLERLAGLDIERNAPMQAIPP